MEPAVHVESLTPPKGHFLLKVFRRGLLVPELCVDEPNLIVTGSKAILAALLGGVTANKPVSKIGFGTSGAAPAVGNTSLTGLFSKALDGVAFPVAGQVRFDFSLATTENNGMAISEFGLLNAENTLFSRKVRSNPLNKDSDLSFSGSWTITF